jgi:hypothetical protein
MAAATVETPTNVDRIWYINAGSGGRLWNMFREGGFISVYHHPFGREVDPTGVSLDQLIAVTQKGIEESKLSDDPKYQARMLFRFVNELQVGDRILAKDGTRQILGFGTIASPYQYSPTFAEVHRREVHWLVIYAPITLPPELLLPRDTLGLIQNVGLREFIESQWPGAPAAQRSSRDGEPTTTTPTLSVGEWLSGLQADNVQGEDTLGVERDAASFARVIADRKVDPPLAIGLFGEWGSGKSFFMHLIKAQIARIAESRSTDFCRGIVQIDFNAWHYVEANLWASLVDNIFVAMYARLTRDANPAVADAIFNDLESAKRARGEAAAELAVAKEQRTKLAGELENKRNSLETELNLRRLVDREFWQQVDYDKLPADLKERLEKAWRDLGGTEAAESAKDLWDLARQTGGGLNDLWLSFRKFNFLGQVATVVLLLAITAMIVLLPTLLARWSASPVSQAAAAIVTAAIGGASFVKGLLSRGRNTIALAQNVRDALRSKNEQQLASLERELTIAEQRVAEAQAKVDDAQAAIGTKDPRAIIAIFIEQRVKSADYARQLGIVASIRRDFESLQQLLAHAARESDGPAVTIDRIVLYIDDLDRCPSDKVVQVLEAIHLLLAFKLFVIVVGVDVRWVENSLLEHYATHLSATPTAPRPADSKLPAVPAQASPHDYLEKIFQIPFWLETIEDRAARNFLRALTTPPSAPPPFPPPPATPPIAAPETKVSKSTA